MLWSIRYGLVCWLLRLLVRCGLDELDLEKAVLRHQLKVLRRGGGRALFTTADRAFLAASARVLSRDRWRSFLVGPDTLVRWHPDLLRRRVAARCRPGRPPLDPSIKRLILRLGRENPRWGLPQDQRRAPQAWHRRLGDDDRHGASPRRPGPRAPPDRADPGAVPAAAGQRPVGCIYWVTPL